MGSRGSGIGRMAVRICAGAIAVAALLPSSANAASTVGSTFDPTDGTCSAGTMFLQTSSPSNLYTVPADGVLTSWSFQAPATADPNLALLVGRPTSDPLAYEIVGRSADQDPVAGTTTTYPDISIEVQQGDVLGLRVATAGSCMDPAGGAGYGSLGKTTNPSPGDTVTFSSLSGNDARLAISASHEADADGDGLGDETEDLDDDGDSIPDTSDNCPLTPNIGQENSDDDSLGNACDPNDDNDDVPDSSDGCPEDPGPAANGGCPDFTAPQTTIKKVGVRHAQRKATIKFKSSELGSTFRCKLGNGPSKRCSSPKTLKRLKPGRYKFSVAATDAFGNTDTSPAVVRFRVKKR